MASIPDEGFLQRPVGFLHGTPYDPAHFAGIMIPSEAIDAQVTMLSARIEDVYLSAGLRPYLLWVAEGARPFFNNVTSRLPSDSFDSGSITAKSYTGECRGSLEIRGDLDATAGRHVILLEDILDSGHTIKALRERILGLRPLSLSVAVLLLKRVSPQACRPDYACFSIPDEFIVGHGLDYDGKLREMDGIYVLSERGKKEL
jgi:hypoxanthine phosphoribosyltransferase